MMSRTQHGQLLASLQHQVLLACNVWVNLVPFSCFCNLSKFQASQDGNVPFPLTYPHLLQLQLACLILLTYHLCLFLSSAPIPVVPNCLTVPFYSSAYETVQPSVSCNWLVT
jgi:hypothetical protein